MSVEPGNSTRFPYEIIHPRIFWQYKLVLKGFKKENREAHKDVWIWEQLKEGVNVITHSVRNTQNSKMNFSLKMVWEYNLVIESYPDFRRALGSVHST